MTIPPAVVDPPGYSELVRDLERWRLTGVRHLRSLDVGALRRAALAAGLAQTSAEAAEPAVLTDLVRRAIGAKAGSVTGRCALVLLGLDPDTFDLTPNLLREEAADIYGISLARFRRDPQRDVLGSVAESILEQSFAYRAHVARLALEHRHPADTRLAVHWLERFESYFKIWTPLYALGADLTEARATILDPDRPWDTPVNSHCLGEPTYSQEHQAAGYSSFALFRAALTLAKCHEFTTRFGGLWLLSSAQAEVEARDSLDTAIGHLPFNERDHSWLRIALQAAHEEMHPFLERIESDNVGQATHQEWQDWLNECACEWNLRTHDDRVEYFPTARYHPGIQSRCLVHQTIEAVNRYCAGIEQEWMKVADWYHNRPFLEHQLGPIGTLPN